jgi:hypothetical protein
LAALMPPAGKIENNKTSATASFANQRRREAIVCSPFSKRERHETCP